MFVQEAVQKYFTCKTLNYTTLPDLLHKTQNTKEMHFLKFCVSSLFSNLEMLSFAHGFKF